MSMDTPTYVLGIGLSSQASEDDLLDLAQSVLREAGISSEDLATLVTLDRRADNPLVVALAERLSVPLKGVSAKILAEQAERLETPSPAARRLADVPSVAEAAALAIAGPNARLVVAKRVGAFATAALAEGAP